MANPLGRMAGYLPTWLGPPMAGWAVCGQLRAIVGRLVSAIAGHCSPHAHSAYVGAMYARM